MRAALSFLTPFGRAAEPTPRDLMWFPVAGAAVGFVVGGAWEGAQHLWLPLAAGAVAVAADAALTGGLHLDGLADAGDGLLPPLPRERRLEAMADPVVGSFGVVAVVAVVLLRFAGFATATASALAVAGLWCVSRTAAAVVVQAFPYARPAGLASAFRSPTTGRGRTAALGAGGLGLSVLLAVAGAGAAAAAAVLAAAASFAAVYMLARRRLGGYTGDVVGAAIVVGETAGLLVLAARW